MLVWILILLSIVVGAADCSDCQGFDTVSDCMKNCSQGKRFSGDVKFPCTIGNRGDWEYFKTSVPAEYLSSNTHSVGAPVLTNIVSYLRDKNPSLNCSFLLPQGVLNNSKQNDLKFLPLAVLANFSSPPDSYYTDPYYSVCPKTRLFDFSSYNPSTFDLVHPRELFYDCFVGLDENDNKTYTISLGSIPGKSRQYNVTIYINSMKLGIFRPAVATYADVDSRTIHVVFQTAPENYTVSMYEVTLKTRSSVIETRKVSAAEHNCTFSVAASGVYFIQVKHITDKFDKCFGKCKEAVSYRVLMRYQVSKAKGTTTGMDVEGLQTWGRQSPEPNTSLTFSDGPRPVMTYIAVTLGVVAGIVLVFVLLYIIRRRGKPGTPVGDQKKKVFFVYHGKEPYSISSAVYDYLKNVHNCDVHAEIHNNCEQGYLQKWCQDHVINDHFIAVLCTESLRELMSQGQGHGEAPQFSYINHCYHSLYMAEQHGLLHKIICLHIFNNEGDHDCPTLVKKKQSFMIPEDTKKLYECLNGTSGQIPNDLQDRTEVKNLKQAVKVESESRGLIRRDSSPGKTNISEPENIDDECEPFIPKCVVHNGGSEFMPKSVQRQFSDINGIIEADIHPTFVDTHNNSRVVQNINHRPCRHSHSADIMGPCPSLIPADGPYLFQYPTSAISDERYLPGKAIGPHSPSVFPDNFDRRYTSFDNTEGQFNSVDSGYMSGKQLTDIASHVHHHPADISCRPKEFPNQILEMNLEGDSNEGFPNGHKWISPNDPQCLPPSETTVCPTVDFVQPEGLYMGEAVPQTGSSSGVSNSKRSNTGRQGTSSVESNREDGNIPEDLLNMIYDINQF